MNYLDIIIGLPILWGIYRGFTKGFIISIASLIALILGVYIAIHFASFFEGYFEKWFHIDPKYLKTISFAFTFILVFLIVRFIGWGFDKLVRTMALGFVNRLIGVFFNVIKWVFILSVLMSIIDSVEKTKSLIKENDKSESFLYNPVSLVAPFVFPYLKFEKVREKLEDIKIKSAAVGEE